MLNEQMDIYAFFDCREDPLFQQLNALDVESTLCIGDLKITINSFGIYEVSEDDNQDTSKGVIHEAFSDVEKCFHFVKEYLNKIN